MQPNRPISATPAQIMRSAPPPKDTEEQLATQSVLTDEGTGETIVGDFLVLKDDRGDNHFFQNWESVRLWAQAKADKA